MMNHPSTESNILCLPLAEASALHEPADALLRSIYEGQSAWSALTTAYRRKMQCAYATVKGDAEANAAWQRLVSHTGSRTAFLSVHPVFAALGPNPGNTYVDALLHLALRHRAWRRPPEQWQPNAVGTREQFASLLRHLFAPYPVPRFLDAAWFEGFTPEAEAHRRWFLHIGSGKNIRSAALPLPLSQKAAHHFLQSPDSYRIVGALRRGQTLALGGSERLAQAIAASRLGSLLPDEPFWQTVIHFFARNEPHLDTAAVGPIVDFLFAQKFGEPALDRDGQPAFQDAPEPALTMQGRTLAALMQRTAEWHGLLDRNAKRPRKTWEAAGIPPLQILERDAGGMENEWQLVELLNTAALMEEGRAMRHCVFRYAPACLRGTASLWSLRVRAAGSARWRRVLTLEIHKAKRAIVQIHGRCNVTLSTAHTGERLHDAGRILRQWAEQQRLTIACPLSQTPQA